MYTFDSRIRYSETDSEGKLTLGALTNYFQDCSTFQSEDIGRGLQFLKEHDLAWVLCSWQIVVDRYPKMGEKVTIGTFPYDFKAFLGYRNFFLQGEDGYIAKANSIWSLLDVGNAKPVVVSKETAEAYHIEDRLEMEYAGRHITVAEGGRREEPILIRKHHLDTNHHVNNGQYVNMALELLPQEKQVKELRVEYKKQAFLGDILYPYVVQEGDKYGISFRTEAGAVYANVEVK